MTEFSFSGELPFKHYGYISKFMDTSTSQST